MPKTAQAALPGAPPPVSKAARAVLAAKARRGERHVSLIQDRDLIRAEAGVSDPYLLVHRMVGNGLLLPVSPGNYIIAPETGARSLQLAAPVQLAVHARLAGRTPYFISYFTGLIEHGLTDLDESTLYVAVRKTGIREDEVAGRPLHLTRITRDGRWFGLEKAGVGQGRRVPFYWRANLERVLLDTLDRPRLCGSPEIIVRAWERAMRERRPDIRALAGEAPRLGHSVARRAAFWLSQLGHDRAARRLRPHLGRLDVPVLLDSSEYYGEGDWRVDRLWGLRVNIPEHAIAGWIAYAK